MKIERFNRIFAWIGVRTGPFVQGHGAAVLWGKFVALATIAAAAVVAGSVM